MLRKSALFILAVFAFASAASSQQTADSKLIDAAKTEDISAMNAALAAGASVKATGQYSMTALQWACKNNHPQAVRLLLSKGANAKESEPNYHYSCLHLTANPIVVKFALEAGADPSALSTLGETPINRLLILTDNVAIDPVSARNIPASIKELLDAGADPNYYARPNGSTYLDQILLYRFNRPLQLNLLRILVAAGVDVNFEPNTPIQLGPPLKLALISGDVEAVRILVAAGAQASGLPRPENLRALSPEVLEQMKQILRGQWPPPAEVKLPNPPASPAPLPTPRQILTAQTTNTVTAMPDPKVVHSSDPVCPGSKYLASGPKDLGFCTTLEVVLPIGSQYVDSIPEARDNAGVGPWVSCPPAKGSVYPFMDCAVNANGYVRFIETSPEIQTRDDGVHVLWQIINWSTKVREGRLTVHYREP